MAKDFQVTITNPERAADWQKMFGRTTVAVTSPIPEVAVLPVGERKVYMLDLKVLTGTEREALIAHIAKRFNVDRQFVSQHLDEQGVPIPTEDCYLSIQNPQKYLD